MCGSMYNIKMSMLHGNIQTPNKTCVVFGMFPRSVLICIMKISTLRVNIQKTTNVLLGVWMFPCRMLILMVYPDIHIYIYIYVYIYNL